MGGERFEINEPGYVFGDNFDLNFLGSAKPHYFPYKKAKQTLLSKLHNINPKQSSDMSSGRRNNSSLIKILPRCRHKRDQNGSNNNNSNDNNNNNNKRDAQTQTTNGNNNTGSNTFVVEPSKPMEMLMNIRKETLRFIRNSNINKSDTDLDSIAIDMEPPCLKTNQVEILASKDMNEIVPSVEQVGKKTLPLPNLRVEDSEPSLEKGEDNNKEKNNLPPAVYNIEFYFDTEVDCSIRIFYLCTRDVTQNGINYKPQHATYKSRLYQYKKGLNQKFDQVDHAFQPCLFDEDLLAYKPIDIDGNYNSKAVYPIVIHCVAVDGPMPRQSQSLIATIEKNQSDESYTIKPLKQLIFVDGIQFILQDIYGAENNELLCVICMSDNRDTMLLPCRHLCLCSPCAQSLTHQANSCPICRRSFKAALNVRSEIKDNHEQAQ